MKAFLVVSDRLFALLGLLTIQFVAYSMVKACPLTTLLHINPPN